MNFKSLVTLPFLALALFSCGGSDNNVENDEFLMPDGASATVTVKKSASLHSAPQSNASPVSAAAQAVAQDEAEDEIADDPEATNTNRADSVAEIAACAEALGIEVADVVAVGNKKTLDLTASSALFIKVKGNKATANITLATESADEKIPGVCIVVAGNKTTVNVTQSAKVGKIIYKAKGNKSNTNFTLSTGAELDGADLAVTGNKTMLNIKTNSTVNCTTFTTASKGNKTSLKCGL